MLLSSRVTLGNWRTHVLIWETEGKLLDAISTLRRSCIKHMNASSTITLTIALDSRKRSSIYIRNLSCLDYLAGKALHTKSIELLKHIPLAASCFTNGVSRMSEAISATRTVEGIQTVLALSDEFRGS